MSECVFNICFSNENLKNCLYEFMLSKDRFKFQNVVKKDKAKVKSILDQELINFASLQNTRKII